MLCALSPHSVCCCLADATCLSAADGCTAAITNDDRLYTWGDGASGNLGYANTLRQFIPRLVEKGLGDLKITQVRNCCTFYCERRIYQMGYDLHHVPSYTVCLEFEVEVYLETEDPKM